MHSTLCDEITNEMLSMAAMLCARGNKCQSASRARSYATWRGASPRPEGRFLFDRLIAWPHDALSKIGLGDHERGFDHVLKDGPSLILGTLQGAIPQRMSDVLKRGFGRNDTMLFDSHGSSGQVVRAGTLWARKLTKHRNSALDEATTFLDVTALYS